MRTEPPADVPLGVVLVGAGRIARAFHLPLLRDHPHARLVAVVDPDPTARRAVVDVAPGVPPVDRLEAVLGAAGVDAVVITSPTHLHAPQAQAAIDAGHDVYVEKPLAPSGADAEQLLARWRASAVRAHLGFNLRLHPQVVEARARIRGGDELPEVAVRTLFASAPRELPAWKRSASTGGGALRDLASHHIDLVRHLLDTEVVEVDASVGSVRSADDVAQLTLHLTTGVRAQVLATAAAPATDRIEIHGTRRSLVLDRMRRRRLVVTDAADPATPGERAAAALAAVRTARTTLWDGLRPPPEPSFAAALGRFLRGEPPAATLEDGVAVARVVDAADAADRSGRRVPVATDGAQQGSASA